MKIILCISLVFCIVSSSPVYADIYKYVDDDGRVWFVDRISAIPERYRDKVEKVRESKGGSINNEISNETRNQASEEQDYTTGQRKSINRKKDVEIYVTSWCPYCRKLENFLRKRGIRYKRFDIEKSAIAKRNYKKLGGESVPLTKIGSQIIRGYAPDRIMSAYNLQ